MWVEHGSEREHLFRKMTVIWYSLNVDYML